MGALSVIVIDEIAFGDAHVHWQAASLDMTMMASVAAVERSRAQWHDLLDLAGLKITDILVYKDDVPESLIVAVPK
jgi:demethylsterigmatocystin 6-O-methyltransferase